MTCLPLLGAQIAKITGTLNLMNEKAKERDHVKRDLQRWLHKTKVSSEMNECLVSKRQHVHDSSILFYGNFMGFMQFSWHFLIFLLVAFAANNSVRRMLTSLEDVLNSDESPLEVKDPLALKFLPSTLLEELRVVKTGWGFFVFLQRYSER